MREVNLAHLVGLVDVEQDIVAVLEIGKRSILSCLEVHTLRHITTIVTDAVVAGFAGAEFDNGSRLGADTAAEDMTCVLEVAGLIVSVADAPALLYEARQCLTAGAVQSIVVDVRILLGVADILAFAVVCADNLRPE